MQCPVDGDTLVISERSGIEIDYCPTCRGVWLDRGELDKIIERDNAGMAPPPPQRGSQSYRGDKRDEYEHSSKRRKKGGFLGEIFDFLD
jgi:Zn-finger nucleic acid-binding protein